MAEEEITPVETTRKRGLFWTILALVVLVVVALAAYIPYTTQQHTIDRLNRQVSSLTEQLRAKKSQLPSQPSPSTPATTYYSVHGVKIILYTPVKDATLTSPVAVLGEVPGNWSFEASFPIKLVDSHGTTVAQGSATLLGDWMTTSLVPFSAQLTYTSNPTGKGTLVLQKDNPSGQATNADQLVIPISF